MKGTRIVNMKLRRNELCLKRASGATHIVFSGNELAKLNLIDEVRVKGDDRIAPGC